MFFPFFLCRPQSDASTSRRTGRREDVPVVSAEPEAVVLDTTGIVKRYETCTYTLPVTAHGRYTVAVLSENTEFVFVVRDAVGNKVTRETYRACTGELKKGYYTVTVGLMRNVS